MSISTPSPPAAVPDFPVQPLTVHQYHQMGQAGILNEDDRVELLEGWLTPKMTIHPPHATSLRRTRLALARLTPPDWFVDTQNPITTADSEVEPDVFLVRGNVDNYLTRHPGPPDIGMVVEVSESTLRLDQHVKQRIYARAHLPVYWIVNLVDRCLEIHTQPTGPVAEPTYRRRQVLQADAMAPVWLDGEQVGDRAVADLLPQPPDA